MTVVAKRLTLAFTFTLIALLLAVGYVCFTQSGTRMAFLAVKSVIPDSLVIEEISGTIASELSLRGIEFENDALLVKVANAEVSSAALRLLSRIALIESLVIEGVNIVLKPASESAKPTKPFVLPDTIEPPLSLIIQNASVRNITITYGENATQQTIDSVTLSSSLHGDRLVVQSLNVDSLLARAQSSGEIQLSEPYAVHFEVDSSVRLDGLSNVESKLILSGDRSTLNVNFVAQPPYDSQLRGSIKDPLGEFNVLLSMESNIDSLHGLNSKWPVVPLKAVIDVQGPLKELSTKGTVETSVGEIDRVFIEYSGQVLPELLKIENLAVEVPGDGTAIRVFAEGSVTLAGVGSNLDLNVRWQELKWPLNGRSMISSPAGEAQVSGGVDSYQARVTGSVKSRNELGEKNETGATQDLTGAFNLSLLGDREGFRMNQIEVTSLGGVIRGEADLSFSNQQDPAIRFTTKLESQNLNPAGLDSKWPGNLSVDLLASGSNEPTGLTVKIEQFTAKGELREQQIDAKAKGVVTDDLLELQEFLLVSGSTRISAVGSIKDTLDLKWSIDSDNMNSLAPMFDGQLNGNGTAKGSRKKPTFTANLEGKSFAYNGHSAERFLLSSVYSSTQPDLSVSQLKVGGLALSNGHTIDKLNVDISGALSEHVIQLDLVDPFGKVSALLSGGLDQHDDYRFVLDKLELEPEKLGQWQLASKSVGQWSNDTLRLSQACIAQDFSKLCIEADTEGDTQTFASTIVDLPISLLARLMPVAAKIDGVLNGRSELRQQSGGAPMGFVEVATGELTVESKLTKDTAGSQLRFSPSQIRVDLQSSGLVELAAQFPLTTQGGITATASLAASRSEMFKRAVSGELDLQIPSLSFVNDYVPQVSQIDGSFVGTITLGGTLEAPSLLGKLALQNGVATFDEPGVRIEDLTLNVTADQRSQLNVEATAKSGGGTLTATGVIDVSAKKNVGTFSVSGKDFQVAGTPQVSLWVSPDLELTWQDELLNITGKIVVPNASIDLDDLPDSAVSASKDQVLVDRKTEENQALLPVSAKINIELQDDVSFSGYGLQSKLKGQIELIERPNSPTTAIGEINLIGGEYEAYGQKLNISTGRLLFVGGPIEAPGIDLRAVRNPTPELEVGITARGSLKQPDFSVFSSTPLSDSEQLAYLIFGRPLNSDATSENTIISRATLALALQGGDVVTQKLADGLGLDQLTLESSNTTDAAQVSLVIGKYLSPKLFVSYGIGLLEPVSTLKLEYALSSKWRLITESSSIQSGVDAQYVIER